MSEQQQSNITTPIILVDPSGDVWLFHDLETAQQHLPPEETKDSESNDAQYRLFDARGHALRIERQQQQIKLLFGLRKAQVNWPTISLPPES